MKNKLTGRIAYNIYFLRLFEKVVGGINDVNAINLESKEKNQRVRSIKSVASSGLCLAMDLNMLP